jgi:NAD(P)-dependent dehydrogenase (short-subunit alcohol dehydrogenase family)
MMGNARGPVTDRVRGKVAVITGGAGAGIGGAISRLLAREGARIVIVDIGAAGERLAEEIKDGGDDAAFSQTDVSDTAEITRLFQWTEETYGRVDILVNNVGRGGGTTLDDLDEGLFERHVRVNLKTAVFCTKAALPIMKRQGYGSVVYISSVNALLGGFSETGYASAKAGLHSLAQTLTADYAPFGIRFNVVCPGSVPTVSGSEVIGTWHDREVASPGTLQRLANAYPLRRLGRPSDVAQAVLFLASDEASWITGVTLPVDGGIAATGGLSGGRWWEQLP